MKEAISSTSVAEDSTQSDHRKRTHSSNKRETIEQALQRISASAEFARAARAKEFLRFVVRHSLDKPGVGLSEREIAAEVLQCTEDWDPKIDPSVRIIAGRLRAKLERYYLVSGDSDGVRIELPKGTYVPCFVLSDDATQQSKPGEVPVSVTPVQEQTRNRHRRLAAYAAISALLVLSIWLLFRSRQQHPSFEQKPYGTSTLTDASGRESGPAVSPDGKQIAFVWNANGENYDIYLMHSDGTGLQRLTDSPDPEFSPAWSPDGKQVAFVRVRDYQAAIVIRPIAGGAERVVKAFRAAAGSWASSLDPVFDDIGPVWSPDGQHLVYSDLTDRHALVEIEMSTGRAQRLTPPYDLTKDVRDFYPRYSPDGKYIAYSHFTSHGSGDLYLLERNSGKVRRLTYDKSAIRGLTWMPDRKHVIFASERDGSSRLWTTDIFSGGAPRLLPSDSAHVLEPASGPSNDWLAYVDSAENWALRRYEVTSSGLRDDAWFLPTNGRNQYPSYSPDGKHIAFISDRSGRWAHWMANSDGTNLTKLTNFEGHWMGAISWSPDGTRLAFDARADGNSNIFMVQISDRKVVHLIDSPYEERVPIWSADGRKIYFSSTRNGSLALYRFDVDTHAVSPSFPNIFVASESFDQKHIFAGDNVGNFNVFTPTGIPIPAVSQHIRPDPVLNWSVSSTGLYFTTRKAGDSAYEIVRYANGIFSRLGRIDGAVVPGCNITASPDGRYIVVAEAVSTKSNLKIRKLFLGRDVVFKKRGENRNGNREAHFGLKPLGSNQRQFVLANASALWKSLGLKPMTEAH